MQLTVAHVIYSYSDAAGYWVYNYMMFKFELDRCHVDVTVNG